MLSVLIPTYSINIIPLVKGLSNQCHTAGITYEIIAFDDGSNSETNHINTAINSIPNCIFKAFPTNIGRSAIRNKLAENARYDLLLFIDAGTQVDRVDFIKNYLKIKDKAVVCGGMAASEIAAKKPYKLRWLFTKKREYKTLCSSNFLLKKSVFFENPFDESLTQYGYEDVLFFETLMNKGIKPYFLKNPVIHHAEDDAKTFIIKTELALQNLDFLIQEKKLNPNKQKIPKLHKKLKQLGATNLVSSLWKLSKPLLLLNFNSNYASLFLFDFYRIGYYCRIKKNQDITY
ncbi:glycosyltransferase family 2 protein [Pseudotamlana carrageenivorans]|uniref:Glycosyl transferase n=1 Tax=Pseudotamlana carrageenivorans TaxID=2069432 RepID=A0A2I7SJ20_9FLAO|nr:glycosyltransferase [Tamlana carrageenivorans]AUS05877.1 glycosyl transferase [Tamlana carrageenivorans]